MSLRALHLCLFQGRNVVFSAYLHSQPNAKLQGYLQSTCWFCSYRAAMRLFFSIRKLIAFPSLLRSTCCFVRAKLDLFPPWKEFDSRTESTSIWMRKIFRRKMYIRTPFLLFWRARLLLLFVESQRQFTCVGWRQRSTVWPRWCVWYIS